MKTEDTALETAVIENIKDYIRVNNLSMRKIAAESEMTYYRLWSILTRNKGIKLNDYVALCRAFREPLDLFIPKVK